MATVTIYKEAVSELLKACQEYREGNITHDVLQRSVRRAEAAVVSVEEKDLRDFLTNAEGQIELALYTVGEHRLHGAIITVVQGIEDRLQKLV